MASLRDRVTRASKSMTSTFKDVTKSISDFFGKFKRIFQSYDLFKEIKNHPWNGPQGRIQAYDWYRKYRKDKKNWLKGQLMKQGQLYMFDYVDPKYKDVLPWFDENPLVISLGPVKTSLGWRTININLHLLPPITRKIVMSKIFDFNKNRYKALMGVNNPKAIPSVNYKSLIQPLEQYGIGFAIRMYIPELQKNIVEFQLEEWKNAIFLESRKLNGITAPKLQQEWETFVEEHNKKKSTKQKLRKNWFGS
ncbi:gp139 [Sphingomonas phage PAU]|uniref:gp139 n=1 Tax=Sphingomonas phage PAU TaxID=1150991 RepID=UPI00025732D7|nr:gp139 [Sphingomonas phage PAU]AFF28137.1 gp139 [Sphingomonas phage PAU]